MRRFLTAAVAVLLTAGWSFGDARTAEIKRLEGQIRQLKHQRHVNVVATEKRYNGARAALRKQYDALQKQRAAVRKEEGAALAKTQDSAARDKVRADFGPRRGQLRRQSDQLSAQIRSNVHHERREVAGIRARYNHQIRQLEQRIAQLRSHRHGKPAASHPKGKPAAKPPKPPKAPKPPKQPKKPKK
jgi:hypothetical protein